MINRRLFSSSLFRQKYAIQFTTSFKNRNDINPASEKTEINNQMHDFIETTKAQRFILSIGSSMAALVNPHR